VIFRRQWGDVERFTFPLVLLPRMLLEETEEDGKLVRPLYRRPAFLVGVAVAMGYSLLQGLAHYIPGMPDPTISFDIAQSVDSPQMKAFVRGGFTSSKFAVLILFVSVALLIDLDMLLSILIFIWLAKIPFYFGELLGWKNIKG